MIVIISLEYSIKQHCYHVSELAEVCRLNRQTIKERGGSDYLLIGVYDTYEEMTADKKRLEASGFPGSAPGGGFPDFEEMPNTDDNFFFKGA